MSPRIADLTLENVAGGAAPELFRRALPKVLENIRDPNTDPKAKRTIVVEVEIIPSEDRESGRAQATMKLKLANLRSSDAPIHIGERDGELVAVGYDPRQTDAFDQRDRDDSGVDPVSAERRDAEREEKV